MFFFSYRGVIVVLVAFTVFASALAWPDSRFAWWVRHLEPWFGALVILVALVLLGRRKQNRA